MKLALVFLCSGLLLAQTNPAPQDKCRVEGKVLSSLTGEPVARARVTLRLDQPAPAGIGSANVTPTGGNLPSAAANVSMIGGGQLPTMASGGARPAPAAISANAEGSFVFANLDPGDYQISVQRDKFQYDAPRRPEPISLKPKDAKMGVVLKMTPLGAIAGVVRDENGDPVQNVPVALLTPQYSASGRQLANRGNTTTTDLGEYRLFGVAPGKYYIRASAPLRKTSDDDDTFAPSFYPGAQDSSGAAAIDVRPGQEMRGIDFTIRRVRTVTARGRVVKPAGATTVLLSIGQNADGGSMNTMQPVTDPEGKFELRGMIPSSYGLAVQTTAGNQRFNARYQFQAGSKDIDNIELRLAPNLELKGAIRIEGATDAKPPQVAVRFDGSMNRSATPSPVRSMTADGRQTVSGGVGEDGTFSVSLEPDLYRVSATSPGALYLKSVLCGGKDVTESGIDVTDGGACEVTLVMSAGGGQLEGQVANADSQPAPFAQVTLVPTGSRRSDLFKSVTTDARGHFTIGGIAPGAYQAHAWEEVDINAVRYDQDFVKPYESFAQAVRFDEGGRQTIALKRIR